MYARSLVAAQNRQSMLRNKPAAVLFQHLISHFSGNRVALSDPTFSPSFHCTITCSAMLWLVLPEVAVTVAV